MKNHDFLMDVFNEVQKKKEAKLLLVGKGEMQEEIKEKAKKLGLENKVIFAGLRSDVPDLMQAMDVFLFPSIYEGLPLSIIEAQAAGLPCLISDRVPIECRKTELVHQIELSSGACFWSDIAIKEAVETVRRNKYDDIKASGFDAKENAKQLESFYEMQAR